MKSENKFAVILDNYNATGMEPSVMTLAQPRKRTTPQVTVTAPVTLEPSLPVTISAGQGKKSDPNFKQVTAYIPKQLHSNATIALKLANQVRVDADKEDFSELLTRLLANWYEKQTFYRPAK